MLNRQWGILFGSIKDNIGKLIQGIYFLENLLNEMWRDLNRGDAALQRGEGDERREG